MLGLLYLAAAVYVGDRICRRFYQFVSVPHRIAAAFLVGILTSSWFTYLAALAFTKTTRPLVWGNLLFFVAAICVVVWPRRTEKDIGSASMPEPSGEAVAPSATVQTLESPALPAEEIVAVPAGEPSPSQTGADDVSVAAAEEASPLIATSTASPAATDEKLALPNETPTEKSRSLYLPRAAGSNKVDWLFVGAFFVVASFLMFGTLYSSAGTLKISGLIASDFGPNTSLVQSFAFGKNFPTQYPHFAGVKILFHFLFWFQAGNLEFLGLDPALSINLLSIFSMVAMLTVTMVLGEVLFNSRAVGRVGASLFFFFGSLSYIPFLRKQESLGAALQAIKRLDNFLPSIWPSVRGEAWGFYSQNIFINQRHIAGAIAVLMLVLTFLVLQYRTVPVKVRGWRARRKQQLPAVAPIEPRADNETAVAESVEKSEEAALVAENEASTPEGETSVSVETILTERGPNETYPLPTTTDETQVIATETSNSAEEVPIAQEANEPPAIPQSPANISETLVLPAQTVPFRPSLPGFIFSGALLGLLPMWNGAVFAAAFALLLGLLILLPLRKQMLALAVAAGIFALPQIIYLSTGGAALPETRWGYPLTVPILKDILAHVRPPKQLHWGYLFGPVGCSLCFDNPTIWFVIKYLGFTVGFKWLPVALGFVLASRLQRRFFLAALSLVVLTFFFQLSVEVGANHKFLHVWIVIFNLFAAYGLYRLWTAKTLRIIGCLAAVVLTALIVTGGAIDLFPIKNAYYAQAAFKNDALVDWLRSNTKPDAIFLSDRFVGHPILNAGRRIFLGWSYFPWSVGYDLAKREPVYKQMFVNNDPVQVFRLLKENGIDYVAFDDGIRRADYLQRPNERVYSKNFQKVWEDKDHRYGNLVIFKVPDFASPDQFSPPEPIPTPTPGPPVNMFVGGQGTSPGRFDSPRGLAIDRAGNFLVADAGNGRIQKFSPKGEPISSFGQTGSAEGELRDPFGIAFDRNGNIYVLEAGNGRIQVFKPDGTFVALWRRSASELDMYGPRRIVIGPDDLLYVAGGYDRIVKFNLDGRQVGHWGTKGTEDGQFKDMTSVAVDPKERKVYATDPGNKRIQIFDLNGNFLGKWPVDEWGTYWGFEDLAIDADARRLYASSATTDNILVFDLNGNRIGALRPKPPDKLEAPTAMALGLGKLYVLDNRTARVVVIDLAETKK